MLFGRDISAWRRGSSVKAGHCAIREETASRSDWPAASSKKTAGAKAPSHDKAMSLAKGTCGGFTISIGTEVL